MRKSYGKTGALHAPQPQDSHLSSSSSQLALTPTLSARPKLGPAPTFDGGVDEDDAAHGRGGSDSAGGPVQQPLLLLQQVSHCGARVAAQVAAGGEGAQGARAEVSEAQWVEAHCKTLRHCGEPGAAPYKSRRNLLALAKRAPRAPGSMSLLCGTGVSVTGSPPPLQILRSVRSRPVDGEQGLGQGCKCCPAAPQNFHPRPDLRSCPPLP